MEAANVTGSNHREESLKTRTPIRNPRRRRASILITSLLAAGTLATCSRIDATDDGAPFAGLAERRPAVSGSAKLHEDGQWLMPAEGYQGTRVSGLDQI